MSGPAPDERAAPTLGRRHRRRHHRHLLRDRAVARRSCRDTSRSRRARRPTAGELRQRRLVQPCVRRPHVASRNVAQGSRDTCSTRSAHWPYAGATCPACCRGSSATSVPGRRWRASKPPRVPFARSSQMLPTGTGRWRPRPACPASLPARGCCTCFRPARRSRRRRWPGACAGTTACVGSNWTRTNCASRSPRSTAATRSACWWRRVRTASILAAMSRRWRPMPGRLDASAGAPMPPGSGSPAAG